MCNAGQHRVAINYALAGGARNEMNAVVHEGNEGRPLSVSINGRVVEQSLAFPPTGAWTVWGQVFTEVMLLDGHNTLTLSTIGSEGANIDSIEVYPSDDEHMGSAFIVVDNSHQTYVNGKQIGVGDHWDTTDHFTFQAPCDQPTVYAVHGDRQLSNGGASGAGILAEFNHCGEVIKTNTKWKCMASDMSHAAAVPDTWMTVNFDDSAWVDAISYGENGNADNYWYSARGQPADEIGPDTKWIWSDDGNGDVANGHNDVFCRIVIDHQKINCKAASDRYLADYGKEGCEHAVLHDCDAWAHFHERGMFLGRVWHSELCDENCGYHTAPFDWIDASLQAGGTELTFANTDDGSVDVDLPFPFPFYGQVKTKATVSANGFLTFSGDHHSTVEGMGPHGGETAPIPSKSVPNDLVSAFWTDLNLGTTGKVYTRTGDGACARGVSNGIICCAASCGTCGGSGCEFCVQL